MDVDGKVAIVTGAGAGIGRALATEFARAGARVVASDIDAASARQTAELIGDTARATSGDASSTDYLRSLVSEFGPVDIFVANAGIGGPPGLPADDGDWDRVLDINLRAHIRAATLLVDGWVERGGGYFVSVASAAGLLTQLGAAGYAVSKHAAVGFAEWLAIAYGDKGIGVSCVCPMGVDTQLLRELRDSPDPRGQLAGRSITTAGEVISPERVAEMTVDAVRENRFMVLPHAEVLEMYRQKGTDYDRWITGMGRYRAALEAQ